MVALRRGSQLFYDFLKQHDAGDMVTEDNITTATKWSPTTFRTYLNKNKLAPFLRNAGEGRFQILRNGVELLPREIADALTQVSEDEMRLAAGERIHSNDNITYELVKPLGRGAIGDVWKGYRVGSLEEVAIKVFNPRAELLSRTAFPDLQRRFEREVKNGSKLNHPSFLKYLDAGYVRSHPFFVMELAECSTNHILQRQGSISEPEANKIIARCAAALRHLHENGCVHRDVKPDNLLHTSRGVVLGDLGIVKWSDWNPQFTTAGTLTAKAVQLGSWNYMAPEQNESPHDATPASDIYALGVTWHELLTGSTASPAAFAAGRVEPASADPALAPLMRRMTDFDAKARPTIEEILNMIPQDVDSSNANC